MEAHNTFTEIHKSSMEIHNKFMIDPWLIIELHGYVFPFWHAILQLVLTINDE